MISIKHLFHPIGAWILICLAAVCTPLAAADEPDVVLDFTDNSAWKFPASEDKYKTEKNYSNGTYRIYVAGGETSGSKYYFSTNKLIIGETWAFITLPTFDRPIDKIVCQGSYLGSSSVTWNVYDKETLSTVSTQVTGCKTDQTFTIANPSADKTYRIYVTNSNNLQISKINIYFTPLPEPEFTDARTGLTSDRIYTVCLDKEVVSMRGGEFWSMSNRDAAGTTVYLEEATAPFAAGTPYLFYATSDKLEVVYSGDATATAGTEGALHGTFSDMDQTAIDAVAAEYDSDIYLLSNNELRKVNGQTGNVISANRAFVVYNDLQVGEPSSAPGRRVVAMPMKSDASTDIDKTLAPASNTQKRLVNGQLRIIIDGNVYDAAGCPVDK